MIVTLLGYLVKNENKKLSQEEAQNLYDELIDSGISMSLYEMVNKGMLILVLPVYRSTGISANFPNDCASEDGCMICTLGSVCALLPTENIGIHPIRKI